MKLRAAYAIFALLVATTLSYATDEYEITAKQGDKEKVYQVKFGGSKLMQMVTAFCPEKNEFVYLQWKRSDKDPAPAAKIWDSKTGEFIELYRFPGCPNPLPIIEGLEDMKVCPFTGDKNFKVRRGAIFD